jgi:hypothetical protein
MLGWFFFIWGEKLNPFLAYLIALELKATEPGDAAGIIVFRLGSNYFELDVIGKGGIRTLKVSLRFLV